MLNYVFIGICTIAVITSLALMTKGMPLAWRNLSRSEFIIHVSLSVLCLAGMLALGVFFRPVVTKINGSDYSPIVSPNDIKVGEDQKEGESPWVFPEHTTLD